MLRLGEDKALGLALDVGDGSAVETALAIVAARFGRLDILVAGAAVVTPAVSIEDLSEDDWDAAIRVNLKGAFLVAKHHWLYPDIEADREHIEDLRAGRHGRWDQLTNAQLDDAGDQEFWNWICLSGAMEGYKAEIVDYMETYIFNSNKCFAVFRPE